MPINTGTYTAYMNPQELNQRSFASQIMRMFPNGSAPLFALTGQTGRSKAKQIEHGYFSKTWQFATLEATAAAVAGDTTLTVASTAGIISGMIFHNVTTRENIRVVSVPSATTITVARGFGRIPADAIAQNEVLIGIGSASEQGSPRPAARSQKVQYLSNYTQIWRNAWALTNTARASYAEAGFSNIAENRKDCAMFHSQDIESSLIFGQKSLDPTGGPNGQPLHTTQGILDAIMQYAPGNVEAAGATTNFDQLEDMIVPAFTYNTDPSGSKERVLVTGAEGNKVIQQIGRKHANADMMLDQNTMGMVFTRIKTYKGVVNVIEHPLFNGLPGIGNMALVLDLPSIKMAYMDGRDTKPEEYGLGGTASHTDGGNLLGGIDAQGGSLTTEGAVEMVNPYACAVITGLTEGVA